MRHFLQEPFILLVVCLKLEKVFLRQKQSLLASPAGNVDVSQGKNVSLHAITSFKTKGKINYFKSWLENELLSLCYSAKLSKLHSNVNYKQTLQSSLSNSRYR